MVRDVRIKEYRFSPGSLTANSDGLFDVYSDHTLNGAIYNVTVLSNTYTATGSLLIFPSGLQNSGTNAGGLILQLRAGSQNETYYPQITPVDNRMVPGSIGGAVFNMTHRIINEPMRIVGSGLGDGTSGIGLVITYI